MSESNLCISDSNNILKSSSVIKRCESNPILTYKDVPYKSALVFNAGITKYNGKYVMIFRNDYGSFEEQILEGTNLGIAFSDDGIKWNVQNRLCNIIDEIRKISPENEIKRAYDPRLTVIDGK